MRGRRNRGGATLPPGERPASLGSTSSTEATMEEEPLPSVKETEEKTRDMHRADGGQGSSSAAASSPSRYWRGAPQEAKKVLGVGESSSPMSQIPHVTSTSELVAARTGTGGSAWSGQQPQSHTADAQGEGAFPEMKQAVTGLIDLSHKKVEHPKLPCVFATNWPYSDADPLPGGVMDDPVILASRYSFNQSYEQWLISQKNNCRPNEVAVKWSHDDDDGIPFPLYAEFCGDTSASSQRREWSDVRIVRKLRALRQQEKVAARDHFRDICDSWRTTGRKATSLFMMAVENLRHQKQKEEDKEGCAIPEYLLCPLSGKLMVDPVTTATGKTFERRFLKSWFEKNGYICPVTGEFVSATILRNERVRGYLHEWEEAKAEWLRSCRNERK